MQNLGGKRGRNWNNVTGTVKWSRRGEGKVKEGVWVFKGNSSTVEI